MSIPGAARCGGQPSPAHEHRQPATFGRKWAAHLRGPPSGSIRAHRSITLSFNEASGRQCHPCQSSRRSWGPIAATPWMPRICRSSGDLPSPDRARQLHPDSSDDPVMPPATRWTWTLTAQRRSAGRSINTVTATIAPARRSSILEGHAGRSQRGRHRAVHSLRPDYDDAGLAAAGSSCTR